MSATAHSTQYCQDANASVDGKRGGSRVSSGEKRQNHALALTLQADSGQTRPAVGNRGDTAVKLSLLLKEYEYFFF